MEFRRVLFRSWKFLRHRNGDVQREAAGREAVLLQGADGAEVGRAQEGDPVVGLPVAVRRRLLQAEAGEAGILRQLAGDGVRRHVEVVGGIKNLPRGAVLQGVHLHRRAEVPAEMEEGRGIGAERAAAAWSVERPFRRSEEHTSELQSLMRISYAVFCLKKKIKT